MERSATVGELTGSPTGSRSDLGSTGRDLGKAIRGEVCVTDDPDESAPAVDDRDALDEGRSEKTVRNLEGRARVDDDRVSRHHIRD